MSDLIAVAYPTKETAEAVRNKLGQLQQQHTIELEDAVVVDRDESGKVHLHQLQSPAARGAAGGALWGGLIGLLFLAPLLGMLVGAAAGGASGALVDLGINDQFMRELGEKLAPGGAALIVLVRRMTPDKVLPEIQEFGGEVIQTSLDDEAETRLREVLAGTTAGA